MPGTRADLRLTALSHGAGCACKLGAAELAPLLDGLPQSTDPDLIVGAATRDDAAVYRVADDLAIVQTADFFTPIVDDPYDFGRIAATNALSDVYAMGARPLLALNLVAYSIRELGEEPLREILRGGADVLATAGVALGGGHSIDDPEPKYGMAVTGTVDPSSVLGNGGGRPGDALFLTKPVGGGLVTTAEKRGIAPDGALDDAVAVMCELNAHSSRSAIDAGATAMTDVTGFGLLGHLHELAEASGLAAELDASSVPVLDCAAELAGDERCVAGGTKRNLADCERFTSWDERLEGPTRIVLADAMTSGGLLVAVPPEHAGRAPGAAVGRLVEGPPGAISVR